MEAYPVLNIEMVRSRKKTHDVRCEHCNEDAEANTRPVETQCH